MTFPKPTKADRTRPKARRKTTASSLKGFYAFALTFPSCVSGEKPVELNHLRGLSLKTKQLAPRKSGHTRAILVPLTTSEHLRFHEVGEEAFEIENGLPAGYLAAYATALLAAYVTGEE